MNPCESCGTEHPDEDVSYIRWAIEQEVSCYRDELICGSAFKCSTCGARLDPIECYPMSY